MFRDFFHNCLYLGFISWYISFICTVACSMGSTRSLCICLMLLACPLSAFSRAPRGCEHKPWKIKSWVAPILWHNHRVFSPKSFCSVPSPNYICLCCKGQCSDSMGGLFTADWEQIIIQTACRTFTYNDFSLPISISLIHFLIQRGETWENALLYYYF